MEDEQIKKIIKNDQSCPPKPHDEWNMIEKKIDNEKDFGIEFWIKPIALGFCFTLIIVFFSINSSKNKKQTVVKTEQQRILEFYFKDSYFEENSKISQREIYHWIE